MKKHQSKEQELHYDLLIWATDSIDCFGSIEKGLNSYLANSDKIDETEYYYLVRKEDGLVYLTEEGKALARFYLL
jgi:hypothetical protein